MSPADKQLNQFSNWHSFFLFIVSITSCFKESLAGSIVGTFSELGSVNNGGQHHQLQHITVDKQSGQVYVGGVNRLYQLSPELDLQVTVETGPENETSPDCHHGAFHCPEMPTDNVNKALLIDYKGKRLIACGTLYAEGGTTFISLKFDGKNKNGLVNGLSRPKLPVILSGICSVKNLENISDAEVIEEKNVVTTNPRGTTVAFIAPGPSTIKEHVLYVAALTYASQQKSSSHVSSRSLNSFQLLNSKKKGSQILTQSRGQIHYVYGFSSEGFSYFLTTQMKELNDSPFISKLVRVCQDDLNYYSYTEIPLQCEDEKGNKYNLVQAAYVDKPGSDLAVELGISVQDDILYAVFAQSHNKTSHQPTSHSALCVYSLKSIRKKFMENVQNCFNGKGHRALDYNSPNHPCIASTPQESVIINEDFCGSEDNAPIVGNEPVFERSVYTWDNVLVTAVAASTVANSTVVFIGTSKGHLKRMILVPESVRGGSRNQRAFEYGETTMVDEGSRFSSDLVFDPQRMHLYAMTERKVTKVRVHQDCGVYKSCDECHGTQDPYCGWCSTENKCSLLSECQDRTKDPPYWISYHTGRCPISTSVRPNPTKRTKNPIKVNHFYPKFGPLEGGTNVTIEGTYLGKKFSDIGRITVAGTPCHPYKELYVPSQRIVCFVDSPGIKEPRRGTVVVRVSRIKGESVDSYEFVDPVIESIHPIRGPRSGGTQLTIQGKYLNAGNSIQAFIDPALPCNITYSNTSHAFCRTSASNFSQSGYLQLSFDRGIRRYNQQKYEYVEDPIIKYAESGVVSKVKVPKGIPAGGIIISVVGNNFESIQEPQIFVRYQGLEHSSNCKVLSNQGMECPSPPIPVLGKQLETLYLDYGFRMDDVSLVLNLSRLPNYHKFELYPDPVYKKTGEEVMYYKDEYLTINGINFNPACQEIDVQVKIGTGQCNVTSISNNELKCLLPAIQPPATGSNPNDYPEVVVVVGRNLSFIIGKFSYEPVGDSLLRIIFGYISGAILVVFSVVLMIVIFLLSFFYLSVSGTIRVAGYALLASDNEGGSSSSATDSEGESSSLAKPLLLVNNLGENV